MLVFQRTRKLVVKRFRKMLCYIKRTGWGKLSVFYKQHRYFRPGPKHLSFFQLYAFRTIHNWFPVLHCPQMSRKYVALQWLNKWVRIKSLSLTPLWWTKQRNYIMASLMTELYIISVSNSEYYFQLNSSSLSYYLLHPSLFPHIRHPLYSHHFVTSTR